MKRDSHTAVLSARATGDVLTPDQRHLVMSRIKSKNTTPELLIRRGLHSRGLRFRLHRSGMPGKPDMVFPKYHAVIFTHGCFWHGHECSLFKWPRTRAEFWEKKICRNRERDIEAVDNLKKADWRVLVIWECALRGKYRKQLSDVMGSAEEFICASKQSFSEIAEH